MFSLKVTDKESERNTLVLKGKYFSLAVLFMFVHVYLYAVFLKHIIKSISLHDTIRTALPAGISDYALTFNNPRSHVHESKGFKVIHNFVHRLFCRLFYFHAKSLPLHEFIQNIF